MFGRALKRLKSHFDLHRSASPEVESLADDAAESKRYAPVPRTGWGWSLAQWLALLAGVASRMWLDGDAINSTRVVVAAITATLVFPTVYHKAMGASESHFMKLCVTFAAGHGYQSLMDAA